MEIKNGTVKYGVGNKTFTSRYTGKEQQSILISMEDGTEERLYFDVGRQPHASVQRGQVVQIVYSFNKEGKRIRQLVATANDTPPQAQQYTNKYTPTKQNNSYKPPQQVNPVDFIQEKLDIFEEVYKMVNRRLDGLSAEDIRAITTSILIEGDRKNIDFKQLLIEKEKPTSEPDDINGFEDTFGGLAVDNNMMYS